MQGDILTLHSLGCHALSISTGHTAQNADRFDSYTPATTAVVRSQFASVAAAARRARSAKIGVIGNAALAKTLASLTSEMKQARMVLDPVVAPTAVGKPFMNPEIWRSVCRHLLPHMEVVTPNRSEALLLTGKRTLDSAVEKLLTTGCRHVLVSDLEEKGGRLFSRLYEQDGLAGEWTFRRRAECHGTGCTLASAVAAHLARGSETRAAVALGLEFAYNSVVYAYSVLGLGKRRIPCRVTD